MFGIRTFSTDDTWLLKLQDIQRRAGKEKKNVPLGSSSMSNGGRGQGATSRLPTIIGIALTKEESPDSGQLNKLSKLKTTLSLKKYRNKSLGVPQKGKFSKTPETNRLKATIVMEELEPLRNKEKTQNESNNGQAPGMVTIETTNMVVVGKSKNESFLNIKKVFKRNGKPTLKNMRIPELIETPPSIRSTPNDYTETMPHLPASAAIAIQSNVPNIKENEDMYSSPEYTEMIFPIDSSFTPSESFEKDEPVQDESECIRNQLPQMSSFEEDSSDLRSLAADRDSISSTATIPNHEKRKNNLAHSNRNIQNVTKESQKISQSQTNGTDGKHVSNSSNSSTSSRSRVMTKTSLVINETSGIMKKSSTFSKNLRIPIQSKTGSTRSSDLSPSHSKISVQLSKERCWKRESGRNKRAFTRTQRRKHEDHLAMIFLGFIFVFLLCHLPRILLDIHELVTREHYIACRQFHHNDFPAYISISIFISHVMLVISSATNLLIYCSLSSTYRKEVLYFFSQTYSSIKAKIYKS